MSGRKPVRLEYLKTNYKKFQEIKKKFTGDIIPMCLIGNRGLYMNAEGTIFPCSWTSFPYKSLEHNGKTIKWEDSFFVKNKHLVNAKGNRSIEEILNDDTCGKYFLIVLIRILSLSVHRSVAKMLLIKEYGVG